MAEQIVRAEFTGKAWVSFWRPLVKVGCQMVNGTWRTTLGVYATEQEAIDAANDARSLYGSERVCSLADIDKVRRDLAADRGRK